MTATILDRILNELKARDLNPYEVSKQAGLNGGYIRDLVRKNANPSARSVERIAQVLGVSTAYLISGETGTKTEQSGAKLTTLTPIVGVIEAGKFRDVSIHSQDDDFPQIPVPQNELFPHLRQYALEVRGDSMNKVVLDGTFVVCVPFADARLSPKAGMIVHVERSVAGGQLVESTLKEIAELDGKLMLVPRSTNEVHKPIPLEGDEATSIEVRGIVVSLWKPLPKRW